MEKKADYRVVLTQKMFKAAFLKLLNDKPIQEITIRELCAEAGVNRGTFYSHYEDIYDLLHHIEDEMFEELKNTMASLPNLTAEQFYVELFELFKNNSELCTILISRNSDMAFVDKILAFGESVFMSIYATDKHLERTLSYYYRFISGGCISMIRMWMEGGMVESTESMARILGHILNSYTSGADKK